MTWRQSEIQLQDRLAHALIDDRFAETVPIRELPCLNWFGVWFTRPAPQDAFVAPEEERAFLALEHHLIDVAGKQANGWSVYWLRLLSQGIAEYYLYSRDASTLAGVVAEVRQRWPEYRIEHESKDDSAWFEYSK